MAASTKSFTLTGTAYVDISEGAARLDTIVPFLRQQSTGVRFHIGQSLPASDTTNYQLILPLNAPLGPGEAQKDVPVHFEGLASTDRVYARVNTSTNTVTLQVHRFDGEATAQSGSYTPVTTLISNMDSATVSGVFHYYRVGNLVQVWGTLILNATAASAAQFTVSLPIVSTFTTITNAKGVITANDEAGRVAANTTLHVLDVFYTPLTTGDKTYALAASYPILP